MGEFDPNFARLKIILIIFFFLFFVVICESVFAGSSVNEDLLDTTDIKDTKKPTDFWSGLSAIGTGIASFFVLIFQLITFTLPSIPLWMTTIMAPIMISLVVIEIYLVIDIVYSFVKALPLT